MFTPFVDEPELLHQEPVIKDLTARLVSGLRSEKNNLNY